MKTKLCVQVLGHPDILLNGRSLSAQLPQKAHALFYYLAITNQPHSREKLATFFWGNKSDARARNNLSIVLNKLKQAGLAPYLKTDRYTVALQQSQDFVLDIAEFENAAAQREQHTLKEQQAHAQKYRGEFLAEFYAGQEDDIWPFEEWVQTQRARLQTIALKFFTQLTEDLIQQKAFEDAMWVVNRQLLILPWHEEGHRQKMRILALQGEREQALAQYQQCCAILDEELAIAPDATTATLYENILANDLTALALSSKQTPFQAPALPPHFVGRTSLLKEITRQLQAESKAPVALVGMGGIGKSTMAAQVAQHCRHHFADGVLWAHADTQDLMSILEHWGQTLGMDWSQIVELENRAAAFRHLMADKKMLIVLDDLRAIDKVRLLIPNTTGCRILMTTRDQDVAYGLDAMLIGLGGFADEESLVLMETIVGNGRVCQEEDHVHQICDLLEHLPLAVEIVAQRLRSRPRWSVSKLANELTAVKSRLDKLQLKDRAVRASFELSWQLLDPPLQRCFAQLAVFAGRSFNLAAATAVTAQQDEAVEAQLENLIALSLVMPNEEDYFRQHALLADFAYEKLSEDCADYNSTSQRMASYYYQFITSNAEIYAALSPEWLNITAAVQAADEQQQWPLVVEFAQQLTPIWFTRARYHEARVTYPLALAAANHLQDNITAAQLQLDWGKACVEQDDFSAGQPKLQTALEQFQTLNDERGMTEALLELGRIAIETAEYEEAHQWLIEGEALAQQRNDQTQLAVAHYRLARLHYRADDFKTAEKHCDKVLSLQDKCDYRVLIRTHRLLALIFKEQSSFAEALQFSEKATALATQHDNKDELATTLYTSLSIASRQKKHEKTCQLGEQSLPLFRQMGATKLQALTLYELSISHWYENNRQQLFSYLDKGIQLLQEIDDSFNLVNLLTFKGNVLASYSEIEAAYNVWEEALSLAIPIRHKLTERINNSLKQYQSIVG